MLSYNNKIQSFPTNILAGMFNFEKREFFEAEPEDTGPGPGAVLASAPPLPRDRSRADVRADRRATSAEPFMILVRLRRASSRSVAFAFDLLFGGGRRRRRDRRRSSPSAMAFFSYFNSDKVALAASRAKPADGPEYRRYHNLVEGLCIAAGLPEAAALRGRRPAPNAFATGRNPKHAALAVTTGLLEKMNRVELEGVLAHELSHVKNYDILVIDGRGDRGRRDRAARRPRAAVHVVRRRARDRRDNNDSGPLGLILAIARARAARARAVRRASSCSSR